MSDSQSTDSSNRQSDLSLRQAIVKRILPLTEYIDVPQELPLLPKIARNFTQILNLVREFSDKETRIQLAKIDTAIEYIKTNAHEIGQLFPLSNSGEKTLHGNKGSHPHYCVYEVLPSDPLFSKQWMAVVATLLPILKELDRLTNLEPNKYADVRKLFCRSLRLLTKPNNSELLILTELPKQAEEILQFRKLFDEVVDRMNIDLSSDDCSHLAVLRRVIEWMCSGSTERARRSHWGRVSSGGARGPRRTGALEASEDYQLNVASVTDSDGNRRQISRYFKRPTKTESKEEAFDNNQEWDQAPIASTLKMQPEKVMTYFLKNRRLQASQSARYAAQAIEMGNQRLSVSNSTLSGHEVSCLFQALGDIGSTVWVGIPMKFRVHVAAWGACRYFLSREPTQLRQFDVCHEGATDLAPTLALKDKAIWLKAIPPKHKPPEQCGIALEVKSAFELRLPPRVFRLISPIARVGKKLFESDYEDHFKTLLKNINERYHTEISPYRVERAVAELMSQLAPSDWAISTYFLGRSPNNHNPAVYSAVPVSRLQKLFFEACKLVESKSDNPSETSVESEFPGVALDDGLFVGSLHVPRTEAVKKAVAHLKTVVYKLSREPALSLAAMHNAYTAYVCVMLIAATGVRAVSGLISANFEIDFKTGICFISDKDTSKYTNSRVVWLCPEAIQQLLLYREHVIRLRQRLALENSHSLDKLDAATRIPDLSSYRSPDRSADAQKLANTAPFLFFLTKSAFVLEVSPTLIAESLGADWKLRVGSLRHFVRSGLVKFGCSGELINALFGHGDRGEAPWGKFSTLPPALWREKIAEALKSVYSELDLKPLRSPLFGVLQ